MNRLAGTTLLALFAVLIPGCETIQTAIETGPRPSARVVGADLRDLTLEKVDFVFDIEVSNPYAVGLPLAGVSYSISSGGRTVVQGSSQPRESVPARGSQVIALPASLQFASLARTLGGVRPGSIIPYRADLTLSVNAPVLGRIDLPLSESGELPVPAVPEVSLTSFDVTRMSLDQVKANARITLKNTNQFAIDLSKVALSVSLGEAEVGRSSFSNTMKLAPGQSATIYLPLTFSPRALGTGVLALLRGDKAPYSLSGSLETGTPFGPLALPFKAGGSTPIAK